MNLYQPLRFRISDWHQLKDCKSNNSDKLHITVSDIINDRRLTGLRICLNHSDIGVLFACVLGCKGDIVDEMTDNITFELTPNQILCELYKYGFQIEYRPSHHIPSSQLDYLITLDKLGFEKIRVLNTYKYKNGVKQFKWYVVAFNSSNNPYWLNNDYCPSFEELSKALDNGSALNISAISNRNNWSWAWLDYVANINDILEENA